MANFFEELKRRKVFQVGAAYLVVGWIVVQVADTIAPIMNLPQSATKYILFLLIVLFPIVLFLAWIFDIKKTDSEVSGKSFLPMVLGVILLGGIGYYALSDNEEVIEEQTVQEMPIIPAEPDQASIAVLAFADLSPEGDQEYFGDGISESLLNVLTKIDQLSVSSRTSSFAFKGENRNVTDIASILNVAYVLEGSVRKAGNRVLITAQLIDAASDRHLYSDTFERELTTENIFAIQAEIATSIVDALSEELGIGIEGDMTVEAGTENMDAYDLYLQAKEAEKIDSAASARNMVEFLERIVELDSEFAEAWAMYAQQLSWLPTWDEKLEIAPYQNRAIAAAERALELEPSQELAYHALLSSYFNLHQWEKVDNIVIRAKSIFSNFLMSPGNVMSLGYLNEGYLRSVELSKQYPEVGAHYLHQAIYFEAMGKNEAAIEQFEVAILKGYKGGTNKNIAQAHWNLGNTETWTAITSREMEDLDPELQPLLPHMRDLKLASDQDKPQAIIRFKTIARQMGIEIEDLLVKGPRFGLRVSYDIAVLLGGAEAVAEIHWTNNPMFWMWSTVLHDFRQTDAFRSRVRSSGMLAYWQKHGWPDLCRAVGEDDFVCD